MFIFYRCGYNTFSFESYSSFNKHFPHFIKEIVSEDHFRISFIFLKRHLNYLRTSLVAQRLKRLSTMWENWVQSLGWEDPLEKEMAIHSSTIAWKIPWTEEPGRLQSMGSPRVRHDWATSLHLSKSCITVAEKLGEWLCRKEKSLNGKCLYKQKLTVVCTAFNLLLT